VIERTDGSAPGRRLLIVDDDRLILKIVHDFFGPHGYEIDEAEDGAAALRKLSEAVPDIIIADILMPNLDGWELFEEVRKLPATARVPFVFLTTERDLPQRPGAPWGRTTTSRSPSTWRSSTRGSSGSWSGRPTWIAGVPATRCSPAPCATCRCRICCRSSP
jgi:CheY-like chemotaxis protein